MSEIKKETDIKHYSSDLEINSRETMLSLLENCPIPKEQLLSNIGLFIESKNLSRILFMDHLYKMIIETQGIIAEFGTRWGQNAAILAALRGIYEPFNRHRKLVAFDTFSGFPALSTEDGNSDLMKIGQLKTTKNYEEFLGQVLQEHENTNPLNHIKKYEICKGDAVNE